MKAREKFRIDVTWTASVKKQRLTNQSATFFIAHIIHYGNGLCPKTSGQNISYKHTTTPPFLLNASTRRLFLPFIIEDVIGEETLTPFCIYHRSKIPCLSLWRLLMG